MKKLTCFLSWEDSAYVLGWVVFFVYRVLTLRTYSVVIFILAGCGVLGLSVFFRSGVSSHLTRLVGLDEVENSSAKSSNGVFLWLSVKGILSYLGVSGSTKLDSSCTVVAFCGVDSLGEMVKPAEGSSAEGNCPPS